MLSQELEQIVREERDVLPFLKKLRPADKKELIPFLKKFRKKVFEDKKVRVKHTAWTSYTYEPTHTRQQRTIVDQVCFICFNKKEIKKAFMAHRIFGDDYLEKIIPWYTPKWYGELINEEMPRNLTYDKVMQLERKGLLQPSEVLLIEKLPQAIVEKKIINKRHLSYYRPEYLLKYPETLSEHIWLLFRNESGINDYYEYLHLENYKAGNDVWIDTLLNLVKNQKLDRNKVFSATILTATKGFNQTLSGWFFELLLKLAPTQTEILNLQDAFFAALNSPHSKIINTTLKYFKTVANQETFNAAGFIEQASILLNSETKSVVNSTLMILDRIAKKQAESRPAICQKVTEALISMDEKIQIRAAKLIDKYGDPNEANLREEIALYADNLLYAPKALLSAYLEPDEPSTIETDFFVEPIHTLSEENQLTPYETLDELIFFVSQVINNNEVYHLDLFLSYLPKLNALLDSENVDKLEPVLKRAFNLFMSNDWNRQIGQLEILVAIYLNDFAKILSKKYPNQLQNYKKAKEKRLKDLQKNGYMLRYLQSRLVMLEQQTFYGPIYKIHHALFVHSKKLLKKDLSLDLLSMPTHAPCWLAPSKLIERILTYEKQGEAIQLFDFQLAIGRIPIDEKPADITVLIDQIKDEELRQVLKYHFDLLPLQKAQITQPKMWLQSVLSRNKAAEIEFFQQHLNYPLQKERGAYDWTCKTRTYTYDEYDYNANKKVKRERQLHELTFKAFSKEGNKTGALVKGIKGLFNPTKKGVNMESIYQKMHFNQQDLWVTIQPHDELKFLLLSPNNPGAFLTQVIRHNLEESTFADETRKKNMVNLLKGLHEIWYRKDYGESTYLFLATGFLCSDKVSRELAAEIWIKNIAEQKIDNPLLGETLGKLEAGEYAPLKRFTDLISANLFNISKFHNEALLVLLDHMVGQMAANPIRGVKKLLELLLELKRNSPQKELSAACLVQLANWEKTKSLKSVIGKLLKMSHSPNQ